MPPSVAVGCVDPRRLRSAEAVLSDVVGTHPHEANSSINTLASFKSSVSKPSVNLS
jgi:hypothetical protein